MNGQYRRNELNAAFWSGGWLLGLAFVFSFFVTLLMLTSPMFMLLIYDRVLSSRSQESLVALFGLVVMLLVLMGLFDYSRRRILARFGARLQERLEARVLEAVEARAARARSGGSSSGTKELDGLRGFFHSSSLVAMLDFIWAPVFLGAVFLFHPLLGWVAVTGVALLFATGGAPRGVLAATWRRMPTPPPAWSGGCRASFQELAEDDPVPGDGGARSSKAGWPRARTSRDMSIILNDRVVWFTTITRHLRLLFQSMTLALGAHLVLGNQLTVGGMVACVVLLGRVFRPVEQFLKNLPDVRRAIGNWKALDAILRSAPAPPRGGRYRRARRGAARCATCASGARTARECCSTGSGSRSNRERSSRSPAASASGKSVLARTLLGQQAIASGTITIGGRNIEQFGAEEIGPPGGYLPEDVGFYPGSILDNISRMTPNPRKDDVVAAAKRAGAHRMI